MPKISNYFKIILALMLVFALVTIAIADTIRLKDGSVIKGRIIGFRDGQFVILIGSDSKGRQRQVSFYADEVDSIEFDNSGSIPTPTTVSNPTNQTRPVNSNNSGARNNDNSGPIIVGRNNNASSGGSINPPPINNNTGSSGTNSGSGGTNNSNGSRSKFFNLNVKVLADNTANGWTNSGLTVRKGQRIRINASGRISLGNGRYSTPSGVTSMVDSGKLMKTEPTGALIAVIGDDNDDFVLIGSSREFVVQRDGQLFLGINEENLNDNSGVFDVTIEAETFIK